MVFVFEIRGGFYCYMGRDKYENEELIKYGWEEDVWFHVDKHSSAHVYVRLPRGPIDGEAPSAPPVRRFLVKAVCGWT